jgi:hypothetical protein
VISEKGILFLQCISYILIRVSNSLKFEVSGNLCSLFMEVFTHFARNFKTRSFIILQVGPLRMTGSNGSDRKWCHKTGSECFPAFFSYYGSSTKCTIAHDRHGYRMWRDRLTSPEVTCTISFIWLLGYLVEIPQWKRGRDRKHHRSTTQHSMSK